MNELETLAALLSERNSLDKTISDLIGRPAQIGHIGEYIAAKVFEIELHASAVHKGSDGVFKSGDLKGNLVNIKFYAKRENFLDITREHCCDYYLALTGPRSFTMTSKGGHRPLLISSAYLFHMPSFIEILKQREVKIGIATSTKNADWDESEVYPRPNNSLLRLTPEQRQMLRLFAGEEGEKE